MPPKLALMVAAFAADAHAVRHHNDDDRFADNEPDESWLSTLAADDPKWVVISGDYRIAKSPVNRKALSLTGLTCFILLSGWTNIPPHTQAAKFIGIWPEIVEASSPRVPTVYDVPCKSPRVVKRCFTRDVENAKRASARKRRRR